MRIGRCLLAAATFVSGGIADALAQSQDSPLLDVTVTVDFRNDVGQNRGSLFEAYDRHGRVVAGAGFLGAYNTQPRSNRRRLNLFLKPRKTGFAGTELPRVNSQTGVYLSDQQDTLLARSRNGRDTSFYALSQPDMQWRVDNSTTGYDVDVAGKPLKVRDRRITYDGRTLLEVGDRTRIRENYYADGMLVVRLQDVDESDQSNRLVAVPWERSDAAAAFDENANPTLKLRSHREFAYAMGQLDDDVLVATNTGGVYSLKEDVWRVIVEPGPHSYQVYSMLNYYDRLLLGHYPSGELLEYDGQTLRPLTGWPPVMPGVSTRAREAQTLAIYGGDLYAGVWPWAEVWRYDRNVPQWQFVRRMFSYPTPTDATTHPYENETAKVAEVRNLWGQRVTSMIPFSDSLYVSTSSKSGTESVPDFLTADRRREFGLVHRLRLPGQLSAEIAWTEEPTTLRCLVTNERMSLRQDGRLLAEQPIKRDELLVSKADRVSWGRGVYGRFHGEMLSRRSNLDQPFLGAYVKFAPMLRDKNTVKEQRLAINQTLKRFRESGLRVVMPYVTTTSGQAVYSSDVVAGRLYDDWDPLQYLIASARRLDLQIFPVICVLVSGHKEPAGVLNIHPEWAVRTPEGKPLGFISPANSQARDWVTSMVEEVVDRYAVDGILLDYLRYPNEPIRLDPSSESEFESQFAEQNGSSRIAAFQTFREANLTRLARQISRTVRRDRPDLKIAIYSWGPHVASNHRVGQAWPLWSRDGDVDMVNISGYCYVDNYGDRYLDVFSSRIGDALRLNESHHGRADVTFCLGTATSHGKVKAAGQINEYLVRGAHEGVSGVAVFTWSTLLPFLDEVDEAGFLRKFADQVNPSAN